MSYQASDWAAHKAPMLLTDAGRPDTTARAVLADLAYHADEFGGDCYPSIPHIQWATGYDERTVQRALRRLGSAKLISAVGVKNGCTLWQLNMAKERPESDWKAILAALADKAKKNAGYQARHRQKVKAVDAAGPDVIDDGEGVRESASLSKDVELPYVRESASKRKGRSAPLIVLEQSMEKSIGTVPGGAPPPDPRRPEDPSGPRKESRSSLSKGGDQTPQAETATHDRARVNADGFVIPMECGYPGCVRGWVFPADPNEPQYRCPNCNSNVVELRRPA